MALFDKVQGEAADIGEPLPFTPPPPTNGDNADPTEAFARHFERAGGYIGAPEKLLESGRDLIELIIHGRISPEDARALTLIALKAEVEAMIEEKGEVSRAEKNRLFLVYHTVFSIAKNGEARKEFVNAIIGDRARRMDYEDEPRRRWRPNFRG